ncbi:MAG: proline iminopeptidase-family hydrolase [Alphaproteobacteria bacterium]|nr:MAG: proline iminopeptidase-family hydrolase [Alphaproteobacteria bacterium]
MMHHTLEKTGTVPVIGGNIHCRYYEPHDPDKTARTPVVFVHGGPGGSHSAMCDGLESLADERPVVFYDQLGSYYSPAELTPDLMTVERFADEISCLMKHLGKDKVILFGHSWGGALAAYFAIHNPTKVAGLVLSCPLLSTKKWIDDCNELMAELPSDVQETIRSCEANGTTSSAAYQAADDLFSSLHLLRSNENRSILLKHRHKTVRQIYMAMWGPSEFSCQGLLKDFDVFSRLAEIVVPTLLLCGEYDTVTPKTMREAQKLIKGSVVSIIPESGHLAYLDNNRAYVSAVEDFFAANRY